MSASRQTGFGSAKPLPGQNGYKESQTSMLERESKDMESRLKMLQERMQQQNEVDEKAKTSSSGGTRWGGASKKKGSVTSYAKDVQERHKKQAAKDPAQRATAAARRTQRQQNNAQSGFQNKDVEMWTVGDVGEWLSSMLLQQHVSQFASNAISGSILLEVSLEDLDYMQVTVLAHRKILFKGIEDLRKNKRVTKQLFAPEASLSRQQSVSSSDDGQVGRVTPEKEKGILANQEKVPPKAHWSTLEPLRMRELPDEEEQQGGSSHFVNGADGGGGMLDEEAERRAFQEAVQSWRQGSSTTEKGGTSLLVNSESGDAGQWSNPFGGSEKSNTTSGAGMSDEMDDMVIMSARSNYDSQEGLQHQQSKGGHCLADGMLDEEKERKEFQAAVNAWRSGEEPAASVSRNRVVADRLAEQMDAMHQQSSLKLREDQDLMMRKIQKARDDLVKAQTMKQNTIIDVDDDDDSNDVIVGYSSTPSHYYGGDSLSPCPSLHDDDDEEEGVEREHQQSHVEVELIQSTMLGGGQEGSVEHEYSVDEPSSDDER